MALPFYSRIVTNPKYEPFLYTTKATVTIINKDFKLEREVDTTLIRVENAYKAFSKLLAYYNQVKTNKKGREKIYLPALK